MTLKELEIGKSAVIRAVGGKGALRQHFLDMGMIPGAEVTVVKLAPMGDPMELQVHGYELTLRLAEAAWYPGKGRLVYNKGSIGRRSAHRPWRSYDRPVNMAYGKPHSGCCFRLYIRKIC